MSLNIDHEGTFRNIRKIFISKHPDVCIPLFKHLWGVYMQNIKEQEMPYPSSIEQASKALGEIMDAEFKEITSKYYKQQELF